MGSKRDGVMVPYGRHGIRVARQVRAAERAGSLPALQEEPRHKARAKARPWRLVATKTAAAPGGDAGAVKVLGRYKSRKAAEDALGAVRAGRGTWARIIAHGLGWYMDFRIDGPEVTDG